MISISADDFDVSIFLTETSTRHSILTKHKFFHDKAPQKIQSNTNRLIGETNETPLDVDTFESAAVVREESDEDDTDGLSVIPAAPASKSQASKRRRSDQAVFEVDDSDADAESDLFVSDSDQGPPPGKRSRVLSGSGVDADDVDDDKKKMEMDVSYEGFAIYGRVLCLVVRKKDGRNPKTANKGAIGIQPAGQAKMENWISSTQVPVGEDIP